MSDSTTPDDARRAVDELEEKIVSDPEEKSEEATPGKDPEKPTPGTEEPPD